MTSPAPRNTLSRMRIRSPSRRVFRASVLSFSFLLAGGLAVACSSGTAPVFTQWEGDLIPVPPATVGGRAAAVTQFERTAVSIQITDGEPDVTYGWRVETGSCQNSGTIQGGAASYPRLTPGAGGTATANATLSETFPAKGAFSVRVFLDATGKVVSCGELELIS